MSINQFEARIRARAQQDANATVDAAIERIHANFRRMCDTNCAVQVKGTAICVDEFLQAMREHIKRGFGEAKQAQAIDDVVRGR